MDDHSWRDTKQPNDGHVGLCVVHDHLFGRVGLPFIATIVGHPKCAW